MSSRGSAATENLPVLEQYRNGIVRRWDMMMSVIDDSEAFRTRMRMMIAELKDLATIDEREFLEKSENCLMKEEKYANLENPKNQIIADKLNVLSEIFRSRVISPRWVLPFDSEGRGGFGQVASTVQQNLQSNFFKLDHRSLFEVFFFVRQIEILLHNLEDPKAIHKEITSSIIKWLLKWGFKPYGVPKYTMKLEEERHRGRKTAMMRRLEAQGRFDSVPDEDDYGLVFNPSIDNVDEFIEKYNIDDSIPNYVNLINYDHLKLLKYRNRTDYSNALIELLSILKIEMKILKEKNINLLSQYVPYNNPQMVSM